MYVVTYSFREDETHSVRYYKEIGSFTDNVQWETDQLAHDIIRGYVSYMKDKESEKLCAKGEHGFEFLVLGELWPIYSGDASGLDAVISSTLIEGSTLQGTI